MTSTLLLRLAAPLQAWGTSSRFSERRTEPQPSKSAVLGLLAAALGRRRHEPIEDLAALRFGVRLDQPGQVIRDFQTARSMDEKRTMPLSNRYFLADAVFLVGVQGEGSLIAGLASALRDPVFPLFLGRRSCPPAGPPFLKVVEGDLREVLRNEPWQASAVVQRKQTQSHVVLEMVLDAEPEDASTFSQRDVPISFDSTHRQHGFRDVHREFVEVTNKHAAVVTAEGLDHDPMAMLGA